MNDIPTTEQGLKVYINYAIKEIKRCHAMIVKMEKNINICEDKLKAYRGDDNEKIVNTETPREHTVSTIKSDVYKTKHHIKSIDSK